MWHRRTPAHDLQELVELLSGVGAILMLHQPLDEIALLLRQGDDDEADT